MTAYGASRWASVLHWAPHWQLTGQGLRPLSNHTFDWDRLAYTNSVLVTCLLPLAALLPLLALYILYILVLRRRQASRALQPLCHLTVLVCGLGLTGALVVGLFLQCRGVHRTDVAVGELQAEWQQWRGWLAQWAEYVHSRASANSLNRVALFRLDQALAAYSGRPDPRWQHWRDRVRLAHYALTGFNLLLAAGLGLFWLSLGLLARRPWLARSLLLWAISGLLLCTLAACAHLGASLLLSDFCLDAKPVLVRTLAAQHSSPELARALLEHYVHCDQGRPSLLHYLHGLASSLPSAGQYESPTCRSLSAHLNRALTRLCTEPVDGLALTCLAYLLHSLLLLLLLFLLTPAL